MTENKSIKETLSLAVNFGSALKENTILVE